MDRIKAASPSSLMWNQLKILCLSTRQASLQILTSKIWYPWSPQNICRSMPVKTPKKSKSIQLCRVSWRNTLVLISNRSLLKLITGSLKSCSISAGWSMMATSISCLRMGLRKTWNWFTTSQYAVKSTWKAKCHLCTSKLLFLTSLSLSTPSHPTSKWSPTCPIVTSNGMIWRATRCYAFRESEEASLPSKSSTPTSSTSLLSLNKVPP